MARTRFDLTGRTVAVTGAGSGIGRALVDDLVRRGARVAACDVNAEGLAQVASAHQHKVATWTVDVRDRDAVFGFAEQARSRFGQVDGVINNAGVTVQDTFLDGSEEDFDWVMDVNFRGVLHGMRAFLPAVVERDDGFVCNISSVFGLMGVPTQSAYNASKFAVRGVTESLRQELAGTGVFATCVHPGGIRTNIMRNARFRRAINGHTDRDKAVRGFDKMAHTTPPQAARTILDGIERRSRRVLIGRDARVIDAVVRLFPERYSDVARRVYRRQG